MTDKELRDAAVSSLKKTTISYPEWERRKAAGKYPDVTKTEWWKAFDYLGKIGVAVPPPPPPPPPGTTTISPSQFQQRVGSGGVTIENVRVTGSGSIGVRGVTLINVVFDGYLNVDPPADGFNWIGGGAIAFYHFGAQGAVYHALLMDGKMDTANCIIWGRNGKLPTYEISGSKFINFMRDGAAHGDGKHTEALMLGSCERAIVEDNDFDNNGGPGTNNGTGHIMIEAWGDSTDPNIPNTWSNKGYYCVRGNRFGKTDAFYSVQVKEPPAYDASSRVYIEPGQPTVKPLCSRPEFVRACA